jgi:hypothetical protein
VVSRSARRYDQEKRHGSDADAMNGFHVLISWLGPTGEDRRPPRSVPVRLSSSFVLSFRVMLASCLEIDRADLHILTMSA